MKKVNNVFIHGVLFSVEFNTTQQNKEKNYLAPPSSIFHNLICKTMAL